MMINHVNEVTMRGGRAIAVATEDPALCANVHDGPVIPEADRFLSPILLTLPAQLISYHRTVRRARGIAPDFAVLEQDADGGLDEVEYSSLARGQVTGIGVGADQPVDCAKEMGNVEVLRIKNTVAIRPRGDRDSMSLEYLGTGRSGEREVKRFPAAFHLQRPDHLPQGGTHGDRIEL